VAQRVGSGQHKVDGAKALFRVAVVARFVVFRSVVFHSVASRLVCLGKGGKHSLGSMATWVKAGPFFFVEAQVLLRFCSSGKVTLAVLAIIELPDFSGHYYCS
jgi:hypothetical protein